MSIKKQFLKSKGTYKVTWKIEKSSAGSAHKINLVGDFNEWNKKEAEFTALKNGSFKYTAELPKNNNYQFRYLLDDQQWLNDEEADGFVDNQFSNDQNCLVSL